MEEKAAIKRRLAEEDRFHQEKQNILIELGGCPSELLTSSAPQRLRQKLDDNHDVTARSQQYRDPLTPMEDPISNGEPSTHDVHEVIPTPLNYIDEQIQYTQQEHRANRMKKRNCAIYTAFVFTLLIIVSTTIIMLSKKSDSFLEDESNAQCTMDRQMIVECASGSLEVPSCAKKTLDELRKELLQEYMTSPSYPCDAKHFGLLAVAVAKVNANGQIDNIFQYWILAILYFATGGQEWRQDNHWLTGKSFCEKPWFGISCLKEGTVGTIDLVANNLVGIFPTEMALLTSLRNLHLSSNSVSGTLPSEIGAMQNLSRLDLQDIPLSGTIPSEIGLCRRMEIMDIIQAKISGTIPTEIGKLSMLRHLGLLSPLEGTLPGEISNLSSLREFDLISLSNLQGGLPSQFANLSNLSKFSVRYCFYDKIKFSSFLSSVPTSVDWLEIEYASFYGSIPKEIGFFQSLTHLSFNELLLTGTLPSELGLMTELRSIRFRHLIQLIGDIPSEIGKLTHLTRLDLSCSSFKSPLPTEVASLPGLEVILKCY